MTLDDLQLFTGAASDAAAQVYVRAVHIPPRPGHSLVGRIHGPFSEFSSTLPASFELKDQGAGPYVLAKSLIGDPCYWTPELPFRYQVELTWRTPDGEKAIGSRDLFLRRLGPRGKDLYLEGRRCVVRAVSKEFGQAATIREWREACPICILPGAPPALLAEKLSRRGVMLVPWLAAGDAKSLPRLAVESGIAMCIAESSEEWPADLRQQMPQTLFWQHAAVAAPRALAPWAQGFVVSLGDDPAAIAAWGNIPSPVIICRRGTPGLSLVEARAECDRLQRDTAPYGDWAGYVIM